VSADALDGALGHIVSGLPGGGEARESQTLMSHAVGRAIEGERHLFVRAGTGTGKSLAYLLPAILSGRRVVVATATKALQDQLAGKDLPAIAARLARPFTFTVLKGRANYLCVQRLREGEVNGEQGELGVTERGARREDLSTQAVAIAKWATETETGDRAELPIEPDPRVWSSFSVSSDECPGAFRCPSGGDCFVESARARAAEAEVIVVNHHLVGAHLASGDVVLPEHDVVVVDEAHELEDVMTASLGVSISAGRLRGLLVSLRSVPASGAGELAGLGRDLAAAADQLEAAFEGLVGKRLSAELPPALAEVVELCRARVERLERAMGALAGGSAEGGAVPAQRAQLAAGRLRLDLDRLLAHSEDDVAWVEGGARPSLEIAPIEIAPLLRERFFGAHTTVLTSATLPPGLSARLGAPPERTDELDVGSPFAFEEQALLYCATHLPDPRAPGAEAALHDEIARLIEAAGGRTLALFTSHAAMRAAAAALRGRLAFPLLQQGDGSKEALVGEFRSSPETCLFATMSFWQGVDVPGSTLSLVIIDRIPFGRPDDPLLSARRERAGPRAFQLIDVPRAAMRLAQGAGRLVRSSEDRGVVAVLDRRLAVASYRWDLIRALPPMRRTKDPDEVVSFLRALRGSVSEE